MHAIITSACCSELRTIGTDSAPVRYLDRCKGPPPLNLILRRVPEAPVSTNANPELANANDKNQNQDSGPARDAPP